MSPTINQGDYVVVKMAYEYTPKRGDIIAIKDKKSSGYYIKRVIALPYETIFLDESGIYVNGEKLTEADFPSNNEHKFFVQEVTSFVPEGFIYVYNDNVKTCSNTCGLIERDAIVGKVYKIYWP